MTNEIIARRQTTNDLAGTPPAFRRLEIACVVAFPFAAGALAWRVWGAFQGSGALLGLALLTGYLASDLLSGVFHWFFDTWFSPDTRFIGRAFVRTFREHHVDPDAICRHDFVETNGSNVLAGCFLMVCGLYTEADYAAGALLSSGLFMSATSQIHKWAHSARVPRLVRRLQRVGVILSKEAHELHHRPPYDRAYCITSGWLNPVLRRLEFFRTLERIIHAVTGALPRRDDLERAPVRQPGDA